MFIIPFAAIPFPWFCWIAILCCIVADGITLDFVQPIHRIWLQQSVSLKDEVGALYDSNFARNVAHLYFMTILFIQGIEG